MFDSDDRGLMIGMAIGIGRRMRDMEADHSADLGRYQHAIDEVVEQRDTHATHLIARNHQIRAMWDAMASILDTLPDDHPMVRSTTALDLHGRPMTRAQIAIGTMALQRALEDEFVYYETLRELAPLIGVRRDQVRAWGLRQQLAQSGRIETARDLLKALR